ncbi:MAG: CHAT domain-containing protein [Methylibium sp.]|uniref:CHAT domain-containing protein n=1 Tax=Methylibium sp. TaxID=2067992 RepID=UPI0017C33746|nr:CHAT domain-containing protein [Methylibium sp.]MBA2723573.1 CHAT domain-containing protein [Methylibium sp.]MBA3588334.1 CHAT domain-containing protein [Methylibium sp.]
MAIDLNLLDSGFQLMGPSPSGGELLGAFARTDANYFVGIAKPHPGEYAPMLLRRGLTADVIAQFCAGPEASEAWARLLALQPGLLRSFIAFGILNVTVPADPLAVAGVKLDSNLQRRVGQLLLEEMSHAPRVAVIEADLVKPQDWPELSLLMRGDNVLGVFDEGALDAGGWRAAALPPFVPKRSHAKPPVFGSGGGARGAVTPQPKRAKPPAKPVSPTPVAEAAGAEPPADPFIAHPRITVEGSVRAKATAFFTVGFSDTPDADADEQKRISIADAHAGETLLVMVSAEGAKIVEPSFAELALDLADEHRYSAEVPAGVHKVVLRANYLFRNKLVGAIVKPLAVEGAAAAPKPVQIDAGVAVVRPLADADGLAPADIFLWVENEKPGFVSWRAYVSASAKQHGPFRVRMDDPAQFAKELANLRGRYGDEGNGARDELRGIARTIAAAMPKKIIEDVLAPALRAGTPTILLLTDQAFVPWELALLAPKVTGTAKAAFLGERALIGRWWKGVGSSGPVCRLHVAHVSAVAASQYGSDTNLETLKYAIEERELMRRSYGADPVEANATAVDKWLDQEPRQSGHLAHIALHGYSDATANAQGLVLGDGAVLTPNRLAGDCDTGETPRFAMVFLNACQVGTGGAELGRMAGFPGALVRGGVSGFIAPLWEVKDEAACETAKQFYELTLRAGGEEVGEALRLLRSQTVSGGSITPWAYLFYGHPRLRLERPR